MDFKQLLGLDVGLKRTGIARASAVARLPEPLTTVATEHAIDEIKKLIKEHSVDTVVIGLPRSLGGNETKQTEWVRTWVEQAKRQLSIPLYWQDEALTSRLAESKARLDKKAIDVDSLAAAIILQDFLDTAPSERVVC